MALVVAGPIVGAVLSSTLPKLLLLIEEKLKKKAELKDQVESMERQLRSIKACIRDHNKPNHSNITELQIDWIRSLRCLAYDMEDCIESFNDAKTVSRKKLQEKIRQLKDAVKETNDLYQSMPKAPDQPQPQDGASSSNTRAQPSCNPQRREQDQGIPLVDLVGKEENIRELLDLMRISQSPLEMKLKVIVISIVGFPGIGKTLLANQVYDKMVYYSQSRPNNSFSRQVLIDARTTKEKQVVLEAILQKLLKQGVQQDGMGTRASNKGRQHPAERGVHADPSSSNLDQQYMNGIQERLSSCIGTHRYLIVVDNVQSEEVGRYITSAFPENGTGSRIIITMTVDPGSGEERCCSAAGHVSKMRPLKAEESVNTFLKEAVEGQGRQPQIAVENEAMPSPTIQKICDGVPLALVNISEVRQGELMQFHVDEAWRQLGEVEEARRWLSRMMLHVLPHCYNSLNTHLQACLLYFAMFPRGRTVRRGSLIRRWQAEGKELGCTTTAQGTENLQALIKRNFVWPVQVSMNNRDAEPEVKTCQSPGMMLDYIISKSKSEEFIMLSCDERETRDMRRLSLHTGVPSSDGGGELGVLRDKRMSRLRTLAIFRANEQTRRLSFENCEVLRVLDLEACHGLSEDQLKEICKFLELLKYLSLPGSITQVPSHIAKLKLLETLNLGKETVVTVPVDVLWLPYLKHLLGKCELCADYSSNKKLIKFLSGTGRNRDEYSKLETLAGFAIGKRKGFPQLVRHMVQLGKVKVWFDSGADFSSFAAHLAEGIKEFCRRASTDANDGVGSASLKIDLQHRSANLLDSLGVTGCKLFYLKVNCCDAMKLRRLPAFIANQDVITKLCLSWITLDGSQILATLGSLQGLKYLKLVADNIEGSIVDRGVGQIQREVVIKHEGENSRRIRETQFQSLQRMCLVARRKLDRINIEREALSKLVSFHLIYKDLDVPSADQISGLRTLKELALHPEVKSETKGAWRKAALALPMKPQVLFSETKDRIRWWLTVVAIIIFVAILVTGIVLAAILIPIARNPQLTAKVEDSRLNTFEFHNRRGDEATMMASIFRYNVSVALAIGNPKAVLSIRHRKPLVATFLFHDRRLNNVTVVDEGHKNRPKKTELHLLRIEGEVSFNVLGVAAAEELKKQQAAGLFKVELRLSVDISVLREHKFSLSCPLRLQLAPPGPEVVLFHAVNCILDTQDKFYF
ncbi:unnamed protein product [Miscanthus lutarioriparius]|uniref:Uncharacterized protein n=1 Tax=Miscanthus lutarioriparius TaxID=422564 RepID=A0A811P3H8_9POAL|nr:unnamed protein product [Miscanthus lutarioriparius]